MSSKPFITLTGADERTDVHALASLDAEIGFLYSVQLEGREPRYPRMKWIQEAASIMRRPALHVCGGAARDLLLTGKLQVGLFQRIQVNGGISRGEIVQLCDLYPKCTIVTQYRGELNDWAVAAVPLHDNHAVLVDASGGTGLSPSVWTHPDTLKPVGFAGGLGPDNLLVELQRIAEVARDGWWVDMETKLRTDDWFDMYKAEECVEQFQLFLTGYGGVPLPDHHRHALRVLLLDPTSEEMRRLCESEKAAVGNDCFNAGWYQAFAWLQGQIHKSGGG